MFVITDFGTSYKPESGSLTTMKDTMSAFYASIEQLDLEDARPSFDIWSLAVIAYKLMAKKEPYTQFSVVKRQKAIQNKERDPLPQNYSQALRELVDFMLTVELDKRPTIQQVLRQPIIRAELD